MFSGSANVALITYEHMERYLNAELFHSGDDTDSFTMSSVFSASLPKTKNTFLSKPVNFTLRHLKVTFRLKLEIHAVVDIQ